MPIDIRAPTDDEWPAICFADARIFGGHYTPEEIEERRPIHDMSRFRIALDSGKIVAIAGSYALDATLPGGSTVPMGGVTWVGTSATHRRQGLMRGVIDAVHDDIDSRGEPVASLFASEGSIYANLGYGVATHARVTTLDPRLARLRDEFRSVPGSVRYIEGDEVIPIVSAVWERFRRLRAGEVSRTRVEEEFMFAQREKPQGDLSPAAYLSHADGYAYYRTEPHWNDGQPNHTLHLLEMAAVTPEAHLALWQTLLSIDLVGEIRSRQIPIDDPLPFLLDNPRALRTTHLNDGVWVNVRDIRVAFGTRTYRTTDRFVVEVDGQRWAIEGSPDGASVTRVRTRPDLVTSHPGISSLLYGGIAPSALDAGRRLTARTTEALARADLFFPTTRAPHCQSHY